MCWHKYKWSEMKEEHLTEIPMGIVYGNLRGKSFNVTYWYQEAYCQKCNKYFYRRIEKE